MEGRQGRGRSAEDNRYENANLSQAGSSRGRSHGYFEQAESSNPSEWEGEESQAEAAVAAVRGRGRGRGNVSQAGEAPVAAVRGRGRLPVRGRASVRGRGVAADLQSHRVSKGQNYVREEERQLTRSVLAISQDPIVGNQQRATSFWERIGEHYEEHRPIGMGFRGSRSLESKWGLIKHDLGKFIGVFQQVQSLHPSGRSAADLLQMSRDLWRTKSAKNTDFMFEHCWLLVKDFPRWADGWSAGKSITPQKRSSGSLSQEPTESGSIIEESTGEEVRPFFRSRPTGSKAAKTAQRLEKTKEGAGYAQAAAQKIMAEASMRKVTQMEEHNSIMLMTLPSRIDTPEAQEYLRLRQAEELKKLRRRLAEDERREELEDMLRHREVPAATAVEAGARERSPAREISPAREGSPAREHVND